MYNTCISHAHHMGITCKSCLFLFSLLILQSSGDPLEDEDESFVLMAVFHAVEDGNLKGIKELVENLTTFDPNQKNKVRHTILWMLPRL